MISSVMQITHLISNDYIDEAHDLTRICQRIQIQHILVKNDVWTVA